MDWRVLRGAASVDRMLALMVLAAPLQAPPSAPPSVVVILMDDIGRDKVGAYADHADAPPTPHLDALAARGVLFRNAWAYPVCSPTRAALLTGRHSDRTGIGAIIESADGVATPLPFSETILPEALPDHASVTLGKWHLRDVGDSDLHPVQSGFDAAAGYVGAPTYFHWTTHVNGVRRNESGYFPSALARRGTVVLGRLDEPFFLYYCPILAHSPWHVPPSYLHTQGTPSFQPFMHKAMVEAFDHHLGLLLAAIDLESTYVFVIGDNGSPNVTVLPPWPSSHGKRTPYEGGVRVPFIVAGPRAARGAECDELVHVTDVFATVLDLVGRPAMTVGAEDSISFAPLLIDPAAGGARDHLYFHQFPFPGATSQVSELRGIRTRRWKLIERTDLATLELYDLHTDPHELNDLLLSSPGPTAHALRDRLLALIPRFP